MSDQIRAYIFYVSAVVLLVSGTTLYHRYWGNEKVERAEKALEQSWSCEEVKTKEGLRKMLCAKIYVVDLGKDGA